MGGAASIESQDPFVLTAKRSYEQTEKFAVKLVQMAVGDIDEARITEIATDMAANDFSAQCTVTIGVESHTGNGMDVLQKSGARWVGCKNEKMETSNVGIAMNGAGNVSFVTFTHDIGFEGGKKLTGFQVIHTFTWDEEGKICEWSSSYDSEAFEAAKPVAVAATEAPAKPAPAEEAEAAPAAPAAEAAPTIEAVPAE